jgi:hypothetical protein
MVGTLSLTVVEEWDDGEWVEKMKKGWVDDGSRVFHSAARVWNNNKVWVREEQKKLANVKYKNLQNGVFVDISSNNENKIVNSGHPFSSHVKLVLGPETPFFHLNMARFGCFLFD